MKEEGRGERDVDGDREMEEEGRRKQGERGREDGRGGRESFLCPWFQLLSCPMG